jgi:hypothetical protein
MIQSESLTENEISGEYHCDKSRSLFMISKVFDVSKRKEKYLTTVLSFHLR